MKTYEFIKIILLAAILIMLFTVGLLMKSVSHRLNFPDVSTTATYYITVEPAGHIWLYDSGIYDLEARKGSILHKNLN